MERALAKNDFNFYVEYVHRGHYQHARHTEYLCATLDEVERGAVDRLMIFMPPRHSKSMTVSETFPSYFIGKRPELDRRVIEVSYGEQLAQKFGRANRRKIEEFGPSIFGVQISKENASTTNWGIAGHRSGMISTGIGGAITGEGADLLIVDDPIKNREEAESNVYREKVWSEWQNTLLTRLHPDAGVIIVLTRWHEDDLAGRLLQEEKNRWKVISLPAIALPGDLINRKVGEPLWPERGYDKAWATATKIDVGTRTWEALYQQNPTPQEGNIVQREWWRLYSRLPERFDMVIISFDCSFKDEKEAKSGNPDYVVGQVWGRIGANKYLIDQVRAQMNFPATVRAVRTLAYKWPQARAKLVEDKANGSAVISTLRDEIPGLIAVDPEGGKIARVNAISPDIEAGNVFLPDPSIAPWIHDYIEEFTAFPNGAFDDQVDCTSQALLYLGSGRRVKVFSQKPSGW